MYSKYDIEELLEKIGTIRSSIKEQTQETEQTAAENEELRKKLEECQAENAKLKEAMGVDYEAYRSIIEEAARLKAECESYQKLAEEFSAIKAEKEKLEENYKAIKDNYLNFKVETLGQTRSNCKVLEEIAEQDSILKDLIEKYKKETDAECEKYKRIAVEKEAICEQYKQNMTRKDEEIRKLKENGVNQEWKNAAEVLPSKSGWYYLIWSRVRDGDEYVGLPMVVEYSVETECFVRHLDNGHKVVFGGLGTDMRALFWAEICPPKPKVITESFEEKRNKLFWESVLRSLKWTDFCTPGKDDDYIDACSKFTVEMFLKDLAELEKQFRN